MEISVTVLVVTYFTLLASAASAAAVAAHSYCPVRAYTTKLVPACDPNDLRIKWPNYENQRTFYKCLTVQHSQLMACADDQVFVYPLQKCKPCVDYLPPVKCEALPTENPPICVPIARSGGTTTPRIYPTPHYPTASTKVTEQAVNPKPTTTTETTQLPDVTGATEQNNEPREGTDEPIETTETTEATETTETTAVTEATSTTNYPAPNTPPSTNTDEPQPSTPEPTPELIEPTPPLV